MSHHSSKSIHHFSLGTLKIFFLIFGHKQFNYEMYRCGLGGLSSLRFAELLQSSFGKRVNLLPNLRCFQSLFFSIFSSLHSFLFFFPHALISRMLDILVFPMCLGALFNFFHKFTFCCSYWIISSDIFSNSLTFSLSSLLCYWAHLLIFKIFWLLHFSALKFPFGVSLDRKWYILVISVFKSNCSFSSKLRFFCSS